MRRDPGNQFHPDSDVLALDFRSAYAVPSLEKLERTFTFTRGAKPSLEVRDAVKFSAPESFETALVTWGKTKSVGPNALEISYHGSRVRVTVDTQGRPFKWRQYLIDEDVDTKDKPFHLGITLDDKISDAIITLRLEPAVK